MHGTKRKEAPRAPREAVFETAAELADHLEHGLELADRQTHSEQRVYLNGYVRGAFIGLVEDVYGVQVEQQGLTPRESIERLVAALRAVDPQAVAS